MADESNYIPEIPRKIVRHTIRGVDYLVSEWGNRDAPLILYLHGWGDTGSTFQFVVDEMKRDWFIVAPDWRGFGGSTCNVSALSASRFVVIARSVFRSTVSSMATSSATIVSRLAAPSVLLRISSSSADADAAHFATDYFACLKRFAERLPLRRSSSRL